MSMEAGPLPEQSEAQRIGFLAQKCFRSNIPDEWIPKELDGGDDFGFDYQIQVMEAGRATYIFRAQLKGTTNPDRNAPGDFFSIQLKTSTVRYYMKCIEPILLVMADLSSGDSPKHCPLYWTWIHEELRRLNPEELADDQKYLTFRIPTVNQLTEGTNLSADLDRCRRLGKVGEAIDVLAHRLSPGMTSTARADFIERLPGNFARRSPSLLATIAEEPTSAWPVAPLGSLPWHLNEAAEQLRQGNAAEAEEHLDAVSELKKNASALELADYKYLRGRLHSFRLEDGLALESYAAAAKLSENLPKHLVAWAETQLRLRHREDGEHDFSDIIARFTGSDAQSLGMRARLLAANGHYEKAIETAQKTPGSEGWAARAIIHTMRSESELTLEACTAGLATPHLLNTTKQLFLILRARARFNLAIGKLPSTDPEAVIPPTGPVGTNVDLLREAWRDILDVARSLRSSGWPSNTEFIADIWAATASILGKQHDALPLLTEAANARPNLPALQVALENIAAHVSDFPLALAANARQPETGSQTLRRVALLHMADKHTDCVNLFQSKGQMITATSDHIFGFAITLAILSAERIIKNDLAKEWESRLASDPELAISRTLLQFWRTTRNNLLTRDSALEQLELAYENSGRPLELGMHLFMELNTRDKVQATKVVALAKDLMTDRMLPPVAILHLSHALATLSDWTGLLQLGRESQIRYESHERFVAIEALALDKIGHSADALALLKKLLATGSTDQFALDTYIEIVVRCGLIEDAIRSVESIVSAEVDSSKRINALRLLFNLIHLSDPQSLRAVDIAWSIGQLTKQDDEEQEGLFLVLMFAAISSASLETNDSRLAEFHRRTQEFTQKFPGSKILKTVHFPENASPDELIRILQEITGTDEDQVRWRAKVENQLQRGEIPIPYAWRPRHFLVNVTDLPTLWEIGKRSKHHERKFHLTMAPSDWKPILTAQLAKTIPLLDLITLLLIRDLEILELVFQLFPKIAIGQATLNELSQLLYPMFGSPLWHDCHALQDALKAHLGQIIQPWAGAPDEHSQQAHLWPTEEVKKLAAGGDYALYSDDAIFRVYCEIPDNAPPSFCTLDVLKALEEKGLLSTEEVAEKISRLCAWHVGLIVEFKYQVAILPPELGQAHSVSKGIDILRASASCMALFDNIWDLRKPFNDLIGHAAAILREFVSTSANREESIAAVMGLWFGKAKLHKDAPSPPEQLLALLLALTIENIQSITAEMSRRFWNIYLLLIALQHGDRMDETKEKEAIALAGKIVAELDHQNNSLGKESLRSILALGLTEGTSDADAFSNGYNKYFSVLVEATKSK